MVMVRYHEIYSMLFSLESEVRTRTSTVCFGLRLLWKGAEKSVEKVLSLTKPPSIPLGPWYVNRSHSFATFFCILVSLLGFTALWMMLNKFNFSGIFV